MAHNNLNLTISRWAAHFWLLASAGTYVACKLYPGSHAAVPWIEAFSEAAMVGGLADWFAVTALFRHPLGLPIPHTAIIPKNQGRIAKTLGRFVYQNFLTAEALSPRLREAKIVQRLALWLEDPKNSLIVSRQLRDLLISVLNTSKEGELAKILASLLPQLAQQVKLGPLLAEILQAARIADKDGTAFNELLSAAELLLEQHQNAVRALISQELPWYIPAFIKNHVYAQVVSAIRRTTLAVKADKEHPLRKQLHFLLDQAQIKLKKEESWEVKLQQIFHSVSAESSFFSYLESVSKNLIAAIQADEKGTFQAALGNIIRKSASNIRGNDEAHTRLDAMFSGLILRIVADYGSAAEDFIEQTVGAWNTKLLVQKIEQEVGADLQFIRINGTIVGGIVGLVLHYISNLLS